MSQATTAPTARPLDWLTLLQFAGSGLAAGGSLTSVLGMAVLLAMAPVSSASLDGLVTLSGLLGLLGFAALLAPSVWFAFRRILGRPGAILRPLGRDFGLSILAVPACMAAATLALEAGLDGWVAVLYVLPAILMVAWLLWLVLRNLGGLSAQRVWGSLAAGLLGVTSFSLIPEMLAGVAVLGGLGVYVQMTPALNQGLEALLQGSEALDDVTLLAPFLNDPIILLAGLFSLSVVAPLVEEFFKPLAVLLLLRRPLTAQQGMAFGALSGAGFALAENLFLSAPADTLVVAAIGRLGASAMHVLTGALGGLALAQAKLGSSRWRVAGVYLLNVLLHAAWNGLVLITAAGGVSLALSGGLVHAAFAFIGPLLLLFLGLACLVALWLLNRNLQTV